MTSTVALRLVANGEAFIAETNRTMSALRTSITAIGKEMGSAFSDNLKAGTREAEAVAQASANRLKDVYRNATLTNGVVQIDTSGLKAQLAAAEQQLQIKQQLLAATERVTVAEGQATAVTQTHIRVQQAAVAEEQRNVAAIQGQIDVLERYQAQLGQTNAAQTRTTAVSGQTRAGMQQLSFQVSDVAASFANGISPMVIFAQQSGQVIQAIGMMSTRATGFLAIMGNPWVLAITSALTVLGTLAYNHYKAGDAADSQGKKEQTLTQRIHEQNEALRENIKLQGEKLRGDAISRKSELTGGVGRLNELLAGQAEAKKLLDAVLNPKNGQRNQDAIDLARDRYNKWTEEVKRQTATVREGIENVRGANAALIERSVTGALDKSKAEMHRYEDALGELRKKHREGTISSAEFAAGFKALEIEHKNNTKALEAETKAQRASNAEREKAAKLPAVTMNEVAGLIGFRPDQINSGKRTPARNKAAKGAANSYHLIGQAIDLPLTLNGKPLTKEGIKAALAPAGVIIKELLGPGDRGHNDHFHVAFDLKRATPDKIASDQAQAEREIAQAAERRAETGQRIKDQMQAQLDQMRTIEAVEKLRAQGRDQEADQTEALAQLRSQYADVIKGNLDVSKEDLKVLRDQLKVLENMTIEAVQRKAANDNAEFFFDVIGKAAEEGNKKLKELEDEAAQRQKRQFEDLATFWERAFSSGGKSIWADFKQMGRRVLSELAAQATISFLGNIGGGGSGGGIGGLFSGIGQMFGLGGNGQQGGSSAGFANLGALSANMGPVAAAVALNQTVGKLFGSAQIKNGGLLTALFGPLGLAFGSAKKGSATLGFADGTLGLGATRGNSRSRIEGASNGINSLADMLNQVADALGGSISGAGSVSLGIRKKTYVVDPTGQGRTKGAGVLKFKDEQAAIEAAFRDALADGVIAGISAASQRILQAGGNIEKAIEKAALIESIPKALKARLNPVGAALTELNDKWDKTIAALKEGGASAEQMADAEKLYRLEREEAMKAANDNLKEFIASLNYGPSSTYSLIDQQKAARADLETYLGKINSGDFAGVDQQRYLQLAQQYLDITREIDGSGTSWFSSVDELRNATQRLADGLSASTAEAARDPFAQINSTNAASTAANTLATAEILAEQSKQLRAIEAYLATLASGGGINGFIGTGRSFTEAA